MSVRILHGDCRDVLRTLPDESVHCVVTSPPYFGLRDYGTANWDGGDPTCDHIAAPHSSLRPERSRATSGTFHGSMSTNNSGAAGTPYRDDCGKCGARRIDRQIGLESTPDAYVDELVAVFREVRRVLRKDGTCWVNLGDSYASNGVRGNNNGTGETGLKRDGRNEESRLRSAAKTKTIGLELPAIQHGCKPKDLIGIPWLVAFALRADGWYLRSDIIWSKPNPMPESVTDRPTKAHEYLFLLTKNERYYYDAEAISEPATQPLGVAALTGQHKADAGGFTTNGHGNSTLGTNQGAASRNRRSVWTVATQPFSEAHFATFPPDLIEPCIKAGTSEKGCCAKCGAPWKREVEREQSGRTYERGALPSDSRALGQPQRSGSGSGALSVTTRTLGWSSSCSCDAAVVPCTVLDPFGGAGTTGLVADRLQRSAILIELNESYAAMSERRLSADGGMFTQIEASCA